jgi:hypothetical protein
VNVVEIIASSGECGLKKSGATYTLAAMKANFEAERPA